MIQAKAKKNSIILLIITLVLVGVWYALFSYIKYAAGAAATLETQYEQKVSADARNRALNEFLIDIGTDADVLLARVVDHDGTVAFIESIETLARQTGLGIVMDRVDIGEAVESPTTHEYLKLAFTTEGNWRDVYTFLAMVETLPYKIQIETVDLNLFTTGTQSTWRGIYEIKVLKQKDI